MNKQTKRIQFKQTGFDAEQGIFEGYASAFGVLDSYGDIVEPGAFTETLATGTAKDGVPLLAQHNDMALPLGKSIELSEDDHGLKIKGYISPTATGLDYRQLIKDGIVNCMSIGYIERDSEMDAQGVRHLKAVDLVEISLVTFPANDAAVITGYKSTKQGGNPMGSEFKEMTTEEILVLAEAVAEELKSRKDGEPTNDMPDEEDGQKSTGEPANGDPSDVDEQLGTGAKQKAAAGSAARGTKAANVLKDVERKYSGIFTGAPSATTREEKGKLPQGIGFARALKCMILAGGDPGRGAYLARANYGDAELVREIKALSVTGPSSGGFLVPEVYSQEIVPLLRDKVVVRKLGTTVLPMDGGNLTIPKITGGTRAGYVGELRSGKETQTQIGTIKLSAKKLTAKSILSNDLIRSSSMRADQMVLDDVTTAMALAEDRAALMGKGTEYEPLGLLKNKDIARLTLGAAGLSTLGTMHAALLKKNANMNKLGWTFNAHVWEALYNVANDLGVYPLREGMDKEKLLGSQFLSTMSIENEGNKALMIYGNWSDLIIGEQLAMEAETTREGVYKDKNGNIMSLRDVDATALHVLSIHDMGVRYPESFVIGEITLS